MNSLGYLLRTQAKNTILNMFRHPAKLISYVVIVGFIVFSVFLEKDSSGATQGAMDTRLLQGIYFVILVFLLDISLLSGVKSGSTFFSMPDVNLLFVSPIKPNLILSYGLMKQMSSMLLMVLFLMFYSPLLIKNFGLTVLQVFHLALGLAAVLILAQFLSMLLYNYCNGNSFRRNGTRAAIYVATILLVGYVGLSCIQNGGSFEGVLQAVSSPILEKIPVVGWVKGAVFADVAGHLTQLWIYWGLSFLLGAISLVMLIKGSPDYYEDVLQSTETSYQASQVLKEAKDGSHSVSFQIKRKTPIKKDGLGGGFGANVFFYKHLCEIRRRNRLGLLTTSTIFIVLIGLAAAYFIQRMAQSEGDFVEPQTLFGIVLIIQVYLLFFFHAAGDWAMELKRPYIYLVPASSFSKLLWVSMTTLVKPVIDGALAFTVLWLYLKPNFMVLLSAVLIYGSCSFLFTAAGVLFCRIFGQPTPKGLLMMVYFLLLFLLALPGGAITLGLSLVADLSWYSAGLVFAVINVLVLLGTFAVCRNVLESAELR